MTLSGATAPGQSGSGSDGNEGVLHIPQSSNIHYWSLTIKLFTVISRKLTRGWSYPSAEMQLVYSTAPTKWTVLDDRDRWKERERVKGIHAISMT